MKYLFYPIFFTGVCLIGIVDLSTAQAQIISLKQLQEIISSPSDKIKVINFWATWCAPCVKELPLFEQIHSARNDVSVLLVSMDMDLDPDPDKVYKFIARKKITADVLILNESNSNSWINEIDPNWTGALPATLLLNTTTGKRVFLERQLKQGELEAAVNELKENQIKK